MLSSQAVLVYPGGARETFKRVGETKYKLEWGNKLGFAKAAIRHGATIIPVGSVGTEDMVDVVYDLPLGAPLVPSRPHTYARRTVRLRTPVLPSFPSPTLLL